MSGVGADRFRLSEAQTSPHAVRSFSFQSLQTDPGTDGYFFTPSAIFFASPRVRKGIRRGARDSSRFATEELLPRNLHGCFFSLWILLRRSRAPTERHDPESARAHSWLRVPESSAASFSFEFGMRCLQGPSRSCGACSSKTDSRPARGAREELWMQSHESDLFFFFFFSVLFSLFAGRPAGRQEGYPHVTPSCLFWAPLPLRLLSNPFP